MNISRQLLAVPVMAFALSAGTSWALDRPVIDTAKSPSLAACSIHEANTQDCHIHDRNAYLHMNRQKPGNDMHHAWSEYREFERVEKLHRR